MRRTILQIDDEPGISVALEVRLRAAGFEVCSVSNGPDGIAAASEHRPAAILLDIRMPGMDGFEVCRRLKSNPSLREIPVIFISGNTRDESQRLAFEAGGTDYLSKPYEARDVLAAIESALANEKPSNKAG